MTLEAVAPIAGTMVSEYARSSRTRVSTPVPQIDEVCERGAYLLSKEM